jgi:hypothetical protein
MSAAMAYTNSNTEARKVSHFYAFRSTSWKILEVWFYINGSFKLAATISSKQFLGLEFSFEQT